MLLLSIASLVACGPPEEVELAEREFLVVDAPHPLSFEPTSTGRIYTQMGVVETLIETDGSGQIYPGLAIAWEVADDGLQWRFTLRAGARFHDGTEVTTERVAAVLNRARSEPGVFGYASIESIDAQGEVLSVVLSERSALLLPVLAHFSAQILAPASFDAEGRAVWVVGTGPYRIRSVTEQELVVEAWEGWQGPVPEIKVVRYLSAGRAETRAALAESGQADLVIGLDTATQASLARRKDVSVIVEPSPRTTYLKVNAAHPLLNDIRVRRALSLAIDRAGIAQGLFRSPERVATQLLPPFVKDWHIPDLPALRTDSMEAERLLAEVGWVRGADGVLVRNGQQFRVSLVTHSVTPELPIIASALQEQFRRIGIEVDVRIGAAADTPTAHNNGTLELAVVNRSFMLISDAAGTLLQDYKSGGNEFGAMGWENAALEAALRELVRGAAPDRAVLLRRQVVQTLQEELPVIPILYNPRTAAANPRVENVILDPLERSYGLPQMRWHRE